MKLYVGKDTYRIGFQHQTIIVDDARKPPTHNAIQGALSIGLLIAQGQIEDQNVRGIYLGEIERVLGALVASQFDTSHTTECYVIDQHDNLITSGAAFCDKRDLFDKRMGRMIAFLKAVNAMPLAQWNDYFLAYERTGIRVPDFDQLRELAKDKEWGIVAEAYMRGKTVHPLNVAA